MKKANYKQYKFDELIRFLTIIALFIFSSLLVLFKSDLARDVVLLIIGIIGGKYIKT